MFPDNAEWLIPLSIILGALAGRLGRRIELGDQEFTLALAIFIPAAIVNIAVGFVKEASPPVSLGVFIIACLYSYALPVRDRLRSLGRSMRKRV